MNQFLTYLLFCLPVSLWAQVALQADPLLVFAGTTTAYNPALQAKHSQLAIGAENLYGISRLNQWSAVALRAGKQADVSCGIHYIQRIAYRHWISTGHVRYQLSSKWSIGTALAWKRSIFSDHSTNRMQFSLASVYTSQGRTLAMVFRNGNRKESEIHIDHSPALSVGVKQSLDPNINCFTSLRLEPFRKQWNVGLMVQGGNVLYGITFQPMTLSLQLNTHLQLKTMEFFGRMAIHQQLGVSTAVGVCYVP